MENKMSLKENALHNCEAVQQYLVSNDQEPFPPAVKKHLENCAECRRYAATIHKLAEVYSLKKRRKGILPDHAIRENLLLNIQHNRKDISFIEKLSRIFTYRIPVYQAAAAIAITLVVFFTADNISESPHEFADYSRSEITVDHSSFPSVYFPDSLNISAIQNIGRSALEDSAMTRFMVTTM